MSQFDGEITAGFVREPHDGEITIGFIRPPRQGELTHDVVVDTFVLFNPSPREEDKTDETKILSVL